MTTETRRQKKINKKLGLVENCCYFSTYWIFKKWFNIKIKINRTILWYLSLWRGYGQVVPRKEQYWCFLGGIPTVFIISMFYIWNSRKQWQIKSTYKIQAISQGALSISLLLWQNTYNFQNKKVLHMKFVQLVTK